MSDRILQKYGERVLDAAEGDKATEMEDAENMGCFGWTRGVRDRAISLELRQKSGHILAINYSYIQKFEFEPTTGITMHINGGQIIEIKGRHLNSDIRSGIRLYNGITRFRVPWVRECGRTESLSADGKGPVVEMIRW